MNILKRSDTDLLAHAMVNVFSTTGHIFKFLLPVIEDEVETTGLFLHILFTHLHTAIPLCAIVDIFFVFFLIYPSQKTLVLCSVVIAWQVKSSHHTLSLLERTF